MSDPNALGCSVPLLMQLLQGLILDRHDVMASGMGSYDAGRTRDFPSPRHTYNNSNNNNSNTSNHNGESEKENQSKEHVFASLASSRVIESPCPAPCAPVCLPRTLFLLQRGRDADTYNTLFSSIEVIVERLEALNGNELTLTRDEMRRKVRGEIQGLEKEESSTGDSGMFCFCFTLFT
jgi:hypothetical protein